MGRVIPLFHIGYIDSDGMMQYYPTEYDDAVKAREARRLLEGTVNRMMFIILTGLKDDRLSRTDKPVDQ